MIPSKTSLCSICDRVFRLFTDLSLKLIVKAPNNQFSEDKPLINVEWLDIQMHTFKAIENPMKSMEIIAKFTFGSYEYTS